MYPDEYILYLVHFHGDRDYFECHEILEEYWKKTDTRNKRSVWVGFIQLAVSCYHHRRCNFNGAKKTLQKALQIFNGEKQALRNLGCNQAMLISLLKERLALIEQNGIYQSFSLPIADPALIQQCLSVSSQLGFIWGSKSDIENSYLVNRHIMQDRTRIIEQRNIHLNRRKSSE